MLRICLPQLFTHAHRSAARREELRLAFHAAGAVVVPDYQPDCQAIVFGNHHVFTAELLRLVDTGAVPALYYVWDLYDCNVHGPDHAGWTHFLSYLKKAARVLLPSQGTVRKLERFTGRSGYVVKAPVSFWPETEAAGSCPPELQDGIVDVLRPYNDPNVDLVARGCAELGLKLVASKTAQPWERYVHGILNAKLLVSAYREASTGGLSLLEGYWHGRPVLLSNSPYHGGVDYFGDRATYFQWDDYEDFKAKLLACVTTPPALPPTAERRQWLQETYSDFAYASALVQHVKEVLG